jgi:hypothetical protein
VQSSRQEAPAIFGLRYLEEEAAEIHEVVGCMTTPGALPMGFTTTFCDDEDRFEP